MSGRSIAPPTQCMIYGRQNAEREGEGEGDQCSRVSHPVPSCTEKQVRSLGCTEVIDVTLRSVRYGVYRVALLGCTCRSHGGPHGVSRCSYSGAILRLWYDLRTFNCGIAEQARSKASCESIERGTSGRGYELCQWNHLFSAVSMVP